MGSKVTLMRDNPYINRNLWMNGVNLKVTNKKYADPLNSAGRRCNTFVKQPSDFYT